jgi:hypothetical protein
MIPQTPKHDFLRSLHELLRPATYLEIGVQTGRGLAQAIPPTVAFGVDPAPCVSVPIAVQHTLFRETSDEFFATGAGADGLGRIGGVDLAFIDGMHLAEFALRDFIGVERYARPDGRTVAVFDDVLPYSAAIAGRDPLPGDWTGDVWKVNLMLQATRPDLRLILVDVDPTGVLVALGLDPASTTLTAQYNNLLGAYLPMGVPDHIVRRDYAVQPDHAIDLIRTHLENL